VQEVGSVGIIAARLPSDAFDSLRTAPRKFVSSAGMDESLSLTFVASI